MVNIVLFFLITVPWRMYHCESEFESKRFIYKHYETKYIFIKTGSIELDCEEKIGKTTIWHKLSKFNIFTGKKLNISLKENDVYGTYYCSSGSWMENSLHVKKIILLPEEPKQREKSIETEVTYIKNVKPHGMQIVYVPEELENDLDIVTWEHPPGTILLDQREKFNIPIYNVNHTKIFFYYRIYHKGNYLINKVGKIFISEWKDKDFQISIKGIFSYGAQLKIICLPWTNKNRNLKVIWRRNNNKFHEGYSYTIKEYRKDAFGNYSCEMRRKGIIIKRDINLNPEKDLKSKIVLTMEQGKYNNFYIGRTKHLVCNTQEEGDVSKDIIWTFQNRIIETLNTTTYSKGKVFERQDTASESILTLKDMDLNNEGTYKCFQGFSTFSVNLLMDKKDILLNIYPKIERAVDNVEDFIEFTCDISNPELYSEEIKWTFIPSDSKLAEPLPKEAKISFPLSTPSSVSINNVLKRHEGIYVCQVFREKVYANLSVSTIILLNETRKSDKVEIKCAFTKLKGNSTFNKEFKSIMDTRDYFSFEMKKNDVMFQCDLENEVEKLKTNYKNVRKEMKRKLKRRNTKIEKLMNEIKILQNYSKEMLIKKKKEDKEQDKEIMWLKYNNKLKIKCDTIANAAEWFKCSKTRVIYMWKIDELSQKEDQNIFSEPFYSHNYRFRLWHLYDFRNSGLNRNYGYTLGFHIMQGDNDNKVKWPMKLNVTISLMNQISVEPYVTASFHVNSGIIENFKRPNNASRNHDKFTYGNYSSIIVQDTLIISCIIFDP